MTIRRVALVAAAMLLAASGCSSSDPVGDADIQRVLIVSMPGVSWADVDARELPHLRQFVDDAAIGQLSTRIGLRRASTTDAYLSIGAGTRAIAPRVDPAVAVDPDEPYAGVPTAEILLRRLGKVPRGVTYLPVGAAIQRNANSSFGARPGRLGDLLAEGGVGRAVIANADAAEGFVSDAPPPDGAYARGAATALMDTDGLVPSGTVGRELLMEDPDAPFGRRLDHDAVLAAFDEAWPDEGRRVVLVEASDLSRAAAYAARATPPQRSALRADALRSSDELLGALVARTDPARDAILVVSPVAASANPELAITALRAPDVRPALLRSPTTRRDGYVQLADVAPTVLGLLDLDQPDEIEGRAFEVSDGPRGGRIDRLVREADAAGFRDDLMPLVVPLVIGFLALVLGVHLAGDRVPRRLTRFVRPASYGALGVIPATFVAARIDAVRGSSLGYLGVVALGAAVFAGVVLLVDRARAGLGPLAAVGAVTVFFAADVVVGAPLQLNAVFGYSVAVAGRFAGLGNLAFALFGSAAVVLAALLVDRHGRRGLVPALAVLGAIILVEGLPMWGADVGGVIAMVPAFGVTAALLAGWTLTARRVVGLFAAAAVAVLGFAFIDAARPAGSRTHLARLAQHVVDGRWGPFFDSLSRRLQASFGNAEVAAWAGLFALVAITVGYVALVVVRRRRPGFTIDIGRGLEGPPRAARDGLVVLAAVGLVANDSSIAVPATMLIVIVPALVLHRLGAAPGGAST
ncbi:MAG: hypothetical protein M3Z03_05605 [Actinomycetota bacterium]|nr:hypothetical protein [Actinomycetota bacterium]